MACGRDRGESGRVLRFSSAGWSCFDWLVPSGNPIESKLPCIQHDMHIPRELQTNLGISARSASTAT